MPVFWILVVLFMIIVLLLLFPFYGKIGAVVAKFLHLDDSDNKECNDTEIK